MRVDAQEARLSIHATTAWEAIGILATMTAGELAWDQVVFRDGYGEEVSLRVADSLRVEEVEEDDTGAGAGGGDIA